MTRPLSRAEKSYARGTAIAAIVVAGSWHVINDLTSTAVGWSSYRWPELVGGAWVVMALLVVAGSAVLLRSYDARPRWLPLLGVPLLMACVVVVLLAVRGTQNATARTGYGLFTTVNWAWTAVGWFAIVLLWRWPFRWLLATMLLNTAVVFGAMILTRTADEPLIVSRFVLTTYGSVALQLGVAGGARALQRTARRAAAATAERAELEMARQVAEEVHADRARRYREVGQAVRAVLAGLAQGQLDPADGEVQRRSAIGAARLRRLIAEHDGAPEPLMHELRACADVAERRDVAVTLEAAGTVPALPVQVRRALTEAPMYLLAAARTHARVTVVSSADEREVEVSVVADCERGPARAEMLARSDDVEVTWSNEGGSWWVRARWHGQ